MKSLFFLIIFFFARSINALDFNMDSVPVEGEHEDPVEPFEYLLMGPTNTFSNYSKTGILHPDLRNCLDKMGVVDYSIVSPLAEYCYFIHLERRTTTKHDMLVKPKEYPNKLDKFDRNSPYEKNVLRTGEGNEIIEKGDNLVINFTAYLHTGKRVFSKDYGLQSIIVDSDRVLKSWSKALTGEKKWSIVEFISPPDLAYGFEGLKNRIPKNASVKFIIEVLEHNKSPIRIVNPENLHKELAAGAEIYDIRSRYERRRTGIIDGVREFSYRESTGEINKSFFNYFDPDAPENKDIDLSRKIIFISKDGKDAEEFCHFAYRAGNYTSLYYLDGGFKSLNLNDFKMKPATGKDLEI